ncbi:MAG: hypothetical protein ABL903_19105 [Methylococcales bacterium]
MTETAHPKILYIQLTSTLPAWAEHSLSLLKRIPAVQFYTQADRIESKEIDIVLHYGEYSASVSQSFGYGRLGLWFFRFNNSDIDPFSAARSAAAQNLALEASLWRRFPDGRCECLYQSFGYLEAYAIRRSVRRTLAKIAHFPVRVLSDYQQDGNLKTYPVNEVKNNFSPLSARFAEVRAVARKIIQKLFWKEQWFIIAGRGNSILPISNPSQTWLLKPPADRFWADPFPIVKDGRQWILAEELFFSNWRGHLVAIELFADGTHSEAQIMLAGDKHLSYPFIFEWGSEIYLVPESSADKNVVLWKCGHFPDQWQQVATLLTDIQAADATLVEHADHWWMFTSIAEKNASIHEELHVYFADSPLGPWTAHPQNPVKSDARNARPAGNLFLSEGTLYRPAQDCGTEYGKATVINRIDRLDPEGFSETPVARLDPRWRSDCTRTHTLSRFNDLWAVDGYRLIPRWSVFRYNETI